VDLIETFNAQAEAIDRSTAALERSNTALALQLALVAKVAAQIDDFQNPAPQGPPAPPGLDPSRPREGGGGGGGTPPAGTRTVLYQGPNGQMQEILDANGRVVSIVPVGPQSTPAGPFFGAARSGVVSGNAALDALGSGSNAAGAGGASGPGVAPGGLPAASGIGLTGTTTGGKSVVAAKDVLRKYCEATEYTIPDPYTPGSSPTKGPWIRRTVWTCPSVPNILPEGGTFTEDEKVAGGLGAGFIGRSASNQQSSALTGSGTPAGPSNASGGAPLTFGPGAASPTSISAASTGPSPGERLLAGVAKDLGKAIDRLSGKIGATDGGLSLRTKGLTL